MANNIYHFGKKLETLPKRNYYVTMTDKHFSGRGSWKGKLSKFVIGTNSYKKAKKIKDKFDGYNEMIYVNIRTTKPYYDENNYRVDYREDHEVKPY